MQAQPWPETSPQSEAQELLEQLVAVHGSLAAAADRFAFSPAALERLQAGGHASPLTLERLRQAVAEGARPCDRGPGARRRRRRLNPQRGFVAMEPDE